MKQCLRPTKCKKEVVEAVNSVFMIPSIKLNLNNLELGKNKCRVILPHLIYRKARHQIILMNLPRLPNSYHYRQLSSSINTLLRVISLHLILLNNNLCSQINSFPKIQTCLPHQAANQGSNNQVFKYLVFLCKILA